MNFWVGFGIGAGVMLAVCAAVVGITIYLIHKLATSEDQ